MCGCRYCSPGADKQERCTCADSDNSNNGSIFIRPGSTSDRFVGKSPVMLPYVYYQKPAENYPNSTHIGDNFSTPKNGSCAAGMKLGDKGCTWKVQASQPLGPFVPACSTFLPLARQLTCAATACKHNGRLRCGCCTILTCSATVCKHNGRLRCGCCTTPIFWWPAGTPRFLATRLWTTLAAGTTLPL